VQEIEITGEMRMKTKALLLLLVGILATTGSTCIQDGFLVAVNLPIEACFDVKSGSTMAWTTTDLGQPIKVRLADNIDPSYLENIKKARYYDIVVQVHGTYSGNVSGFAYINDKPLITFTGAWSDFLVGRSLFSDSTQHVTLQPGGALELKTVLDSLAGHPQTEVKLTSNGLLTGQSPVPPGLSVCLKVLGQVDSEVK
jgi:hypothetical protein